MSSTKGEGGTYSHGDGELRPGYTIMVGLTEGIGSLKPAYGMARRA